jgi:O-antigen/teichoic acid export membrane protein
MDVTTNRRSRLIKAVTASIFSKFLAFFVQILAFPFALHSLGTDNYASYLALQSFLSWTSLCGLGVSMSLPKYIAASSIRQDRSEERDLVLTAITLLGLASTAVLSLLAIMGQLFSPATMVAASSRVSSEEIRIAYYVAAMLSAAQLFVSVESSIRSGYQELYRSSVCAAIASLAFVLPGLVYVGLHRVSIAAFMMIIYLPLVVLLLADLVILFIQRPYLVRGQFRFRTTAARILPSSVNALAFQIEYALIVYLPTWIVAHMTSAEETAAFGSILQIMGLGAASLNLFFQPVVAAIANAHGHNDRLWIERNYKRFLFLVIAAGLAAFLASATIGPFIVRLWLGHAVTVPRTMLAWFGAYFLFLSVSLYQFYILSAMGALRGTGFVYLAQGILALALGSVLCAFYGATGMVGGLAIGVAITGWILPVKVRREIQSLN